MESRLYIRGIRLLGIGIFELLSIFILFYFVSYTYH